MAGAPKKKGAKKRATARPARPGAPVLGNDPFLRGAAVRPTRVAAAVQVAEARAQVTAGAATGSAPVRAVPSPAAAPPMPAGRGAVTAAVGAVDSARERLEEVEKKLEGALSGVEERLAGLAARTGLADARAEVREAVAQLLPTLRQKLAGVVDLARLLEGPERLDRYGMDERFAGRAEPILEALYAHWWRVQVRYAERVPDVGPAVVVANHAGVVPWDALVLRHALRRDHTAHRDLRPLLDDREVELPFFGGLAVRMGAVRAAPGPAERILTDGGVVGVFPEGSAGARKPWRDRYRLQRFGRGGFVKIALRTGAPIVPCAIVGSEEAAPGISRAGWLAERLGLPLLSTSPHFVLSPAALLPLPSRWSLRFGEPIDTASHGPGAADDAPLVNSLAEQARAALQAMLDEDVASRPGVFL